MAVLRQLAEQNPAYDAVQPSEAEMLRFSASEANKANERSDYDAVQPSEAEMLRFSASEASKTNERSDYGAEHEKRAPNGLFFLLFITHKSTPVACVFFAFRVLHFPHISYMKHYGE